MERPVVGASYRHFKGGEYRILAIAKHSDTEEELVVYQSLLDENAIWARPLSAFLEHVERPDHHYSGPRFQKLA